ncbi:tyrosine-type recombinase/integrase [uncultured Parabacteroides sp.]|uniref:tyrosine-type recombinase/integrase n=1 Tax=uncultured Parabacteroides sp. TaxID=512312 RepID=UPI0026DA9EA0|nr:tyrosine-type recombinase/integrase [uncultured Parabacteroides sp.]
MKQLFTKLSKDFVANQDIRDNSRALYLRILNQFAKWVVITGRNIKGLKRSDVIEYKSTLLREEKSENTIDSYLTVVRMFFEYCEAIGEHENIAAGIKIKHKRIGYRKSHLSIDEISSLYSVIGTETVSGKRDYALINLMLRSGIRCVEASRLRVCDVSMYDGKCSILIQRKGDNERTERLGLTNKAIQPVMDYISFRGVSDRSEYVFLTHCTTGEHPLTAKGISKIVTGYMKMAGVYSKQKTAHSLRHTAAVQAIMNKVPIKEVQLMLGHRRVETTEIYLKSIDEDLRLDNPAVRALDDAF